MRPPAVAGRFYAADPAVLERDLRRAFASPLGPGSLPDTRVDGPREILGALVPHAGHMFSGAVAAHAYAALARDGVPDAVVIIGPNHYGVGAGVAVSPEGMMTPLGPIETDAGIISKLGPTIQEDRLAHRREHSIEVQLPFVKLIWPDVKVVAISMMDQSPAAVQAASGELSRACAGRDVAFIASSDLSHYLPPAQAEAQDRKAIDAMLSMDPDRLLSVVRREGISMCGPGPAAVMMALCASGRAELLKRATSGDVEPMGEVVGYASLAVRRAVRD